ncbi:MAG: hypothetical protein GF331_04380, partial [Chitinivibrionales bacterium]|nr:hypothetical protein [Chitinivibrionales bacterium]
MDTRYRRPFLIVLGVAVLVRLFFVFALPFGDEIGALGLEGLNDEPAHNNYVKYLAAHWRFPVQTQSVADPDALVRNEFEYYQPPLYYLIAAGLHRLFGAEAGFLLARLLSCAFGLGVVWA